MFDLLFGDIIGVDLNDFWLKLSVATILFNPIFWNFAARFEYKWHLISKIAGGNRLAGCYLLAATIFLLGLFRDFVELGALLIVLGNVFVLSSMWRLGITGTYLGDYFGILMNQRVTSFPFNVMNNPMYNGSTMIFAGFALRNDSMVGLLLTSLVYLLYRVALLFEEPYTAKIYAARSKIKRK